MKYFQNYQFLLIGLVFLSLFVFPVVEAGWVSDFFDDSRDVLSFGSFYQGTHDVGYDLAESDVISLLPYERECLSASFNEQIEFSWVYGTKISEGLSSSYCDVFLKTTCDSRGCAWDSYSGCYAPSATYADVYIYNDNPSIGLIKSGDSHCFGYDDYAIEIKWKRYVKAGSDDFGNHKTQVYRCVSHEWITYGYFDEAYGNALGGYWCDDKDDKGWLDFDRDFHCRSSSKSSWCTERKDAYWCMNEENGRVSSDMCDTENDYLEGALISRLDDGSYCCESRSPSGDDPASWYDFASNTDGNIWSDIDAVADVFTSGSLDDTISDVFSWAKWIFLAVVGFFLLPFILPTFLRWFALIKRMIGM